MVKRGFGYQGSKKEKNGTKTFTLLIGFLFKIITAILLGLIHLASSLYNSYKKKKIKSE